MDGWMGGWMTRWMDPWMDGWIIHHWDMSFEIVPNEPNYASWSYGGVWNVGDW